jgi:murein DD-endopeptidase MepM/ murein hydrolase activator NlpD
LKKWFSLLAIGIFLSACHPQMVMGTSMPTAETLTPTQTTTPTQRATITSQATLLSATPTSTEELMWICSPLEEETLDTLSLIVVNPMVIPAFGRDDGHHGVDFAYYRRGERESIQGIEVYAVLSGKTVQTLEDNTPYGYAILVETPLSDLPRNLQEDLATLYQPVPENIQYQGECPQIDPPEVTEELSLYHLYAHLEQKPNFKSGDPVSCGTLLGTVGNTGRSSNPHLHLETRLGPSGATIGDMAFYETIYTEEQRADYCLWRMSGYYQLFDPFLLFEHGR